MRSSTNIMRCLAAAVLSACAISVAQASSTSQLFMEVGEAALPPVAFSSFCLRKPQRCAGADKIEKVRLSETLLGQLASINREVNHSIIPVRQPPNAPWRDDAAFGDCKQFALAKRSRLLDAGLPSSALLFALARLSSGEGHLVLVVATDRGELVLDNLADDIAQWQALPYTWVERSSPTNPLFWQTIVEHKELAQTLAGGGGPGEAESIGHHAMLGGSRKPSHAESAR
jgi:predicted transglutaminase-like cysteine proteinase